MSEPGVAETAQARALVREAVGQVKKSTLIELDRADPANAPLVAKFPLAGAPLPLILVVAPNGAVAGGVPAKQVKAGRLVAMVPSPKKAEILRLLQDGKPVFVVIGRKGMSAQSAAAVNCSAACSQMGNASAIVNVDMDDPQEVTFLDQMKVDRASKEPVTLVVNTQGQVTADRHRPPRCRLHSLTHEDTAVRAHRQPLDERIRRRRRRERNDLDQPRD